MEISDADFCFAFAFWYDADLCADSRSDMPLIHFMMQISNPIELISWSIALAPDLWFTVFCPGETLPSCKWPLVPYIHSYRENGICRGTVRGSGWRLLSTSLAVFIILLDATWNPSTLCWQTPPEHLPSDPRTHYTLELHPRKFSSFLFSVSHLLR